MTYIDGVIIPVPTKNKEAYLQYAKDMSEIFKAHGVMRFVECWGDELPDGEVTSYPLAVKKKDDESVCFSWAEWPSKQVHDDAMPKIMEEMQKLHDDAGMPFDGSRLIYGGFDVILDD